VPFAFSAFSFPIPPSTFPYRVCSNKCSNVCSLFWRASCYPGATAKSRPKGNHMKRRKHALLNMQKKPRPSVTPSTDVTPSPHVTPSSHVTFSHPVTLSSHVTPVTSSCTPPLPVTPSPALPWESGPGGEVPVTPPRFHRDSSLATSFTPPQAAGPGGEVPVTPSPKNRATRIVRRCTECRTAFYAAYVNALTCSLRCRVRRHRRLRKGT
jgi:hypothetical protein